MFNPNLVVEKIVRQPAVTALFLLLARLGLSAIFVISGWGKLSDYAGTAGYMEAMGVPSGLLPLVIFAELGGGLAILFGLQTRLAALGLAVFSVLTAVLFHVGGADAAQQMSNQINFMKNIAMAGGFLALAVVGAGSISLDRVIEK